MQIPTFVHRLRQPIYWCSINCFHANIHAHTHHHVHRTLYTVMFFFDDKLIVHMFMYTFTIACIYPMHACSFIHSMFSVHACTDICASSMTTDRLMFHEVFPCKYSCAYSSACAHNIVHSNRFLLWQTCSTPVHLHFHHCLHVFTACMFMYSLLFLDRATTNISASSTTTDQCSINPL